jgi:hypothetical protein
MKYRAPRPLGGHKKPTNVPPTITAGRCGWCSREWKLEDYKPFTDGEDEFMDIGFTIGSDGGFVQLCPRCTSLMDAFEARVRRPPGAKSDA